MKDWLHDNDLLAVEMGISMRKWPRIRQELIERSLLSAEVHPVEGPILRATRPDHLVAVGLMLMQRGGR